MLRLAIALVLVSTATAANAEDTMSAQSQSPAAANPSEPRPFLFDGRMKDDGTRRRTFADDDHPNGGAIVMPPKAGDPERKR